MKAQIVSLGYALPAFTYSQEEIFACLGYPKHFSRIFRESQIQQRSFCIPIDRITGLSFQEQQELYREHAADLSVLAVLNCLDGRDPKTIGCLTYCSCTGIAPGPTIGHEIARRLAMRDDLIITNITAMGCEGGGLPGLKRAADYTLSMGQPSLVVATELCSLTHFPESDGPDPENDYELLRANAVFADGSSAALIGQDGKYQHPYIVDSLVYTKADYSDKLGYVWRNGRLRVRLAKDVPQYAAEVAMEAIRRILHKHHLTYAQIKHWLVHGAGSAVLDRIQEGLGLSKHSLDLSRQTLRLMGNVSSATVGITGKLLMLSGAPQAGDRGMIVTVAPGMSGGASLLRWHADWDSEP